jgi:hypothetical protein
VTHITIVRLGPIGARSPTHPPVLDALRRRDTVLAVEVLHEHFANAAAMLARHWGDADVPGATGAAVDAPVLIPRLA